MADDEHDDDAVGYGKPPKHSRFQRGQSGNPAGRPPGRKNLATMIRSVMGEEIIVQQNGRNRTMTKAEAALTQAANLALKGDMRALRELLGLLRYAEQADATGPEVYEPNESDESVLANLYKRMQTNNAVTTETDKDEVSK